MPAQPFIPGIMPPDTSIAQLILQAGNQAAENSRRQYDTIGQGIASLGQIPGQIVQHKRLEAQTALEQARAQREQQTADMQAKALAKQQAQDAALTEYLKSTEQPDPKALMSIVGPERGVKIAEGLNSFQALATKQGEEALAHLPGLINGMDALSPEMRAGFWPHAKQVVARAGLIDPTKLPDQLDQQTWAQIKAFGARLAPVKPLDVAPEHSLVDPNTMQPTYTAPAAAPKVTAGSFEDFAQRQFGRTPTPQQLLQARTQWAAAGKEPENADNAPTLSTGAMEQAAVRYLTDGTLPPMGMGKAGARVREAILNRAAQIDPSADIAMRKAGFGSDTASLKKLQAQTDAVSAFESTATKNAVILEEALKKLPDTGARFLNRPWRALSSQLGSEDMAKFETIRQSVQNEYARIISNPSLSGTMSDSARKEAETLLSPSATAGQMRIALETLKREAANRHESYQGQLDEIKGRMKGHGEKPAATVAPVTPPAGPKQIKSDAEYEALPSGAEFIAPDGSHRRKP